MFPSFDIILAVAALSSKGLQLVSANPVAEVEKRAPYYPAITSPTAAAYWTIDHQAYVTWDASLVPTDADPIPWVQLYNTTDYGSANYVTTLASSFPAQPGKVTFTVPEVVPGSYFVMLGEWGQSSPHFTIGAIDIPSAPHIESPNTNTVWQLGTQQDVTWDTSNIREDAENIAFVDLYKTSSYGSAEFVLEIAVNIPPQQGSVSFTVPEDLTPEDDYFVMVGIWGNSSPHFTISQ
ncbi:hypothetical protein BC835DRAFT_1413106 [Cytidiella melzeri]|nr:hypothetical protein BC835DRAFT_1413106 [Cytidiella melzeri]